jgi:excisionase family DNA binding protein
MTDLVKVDRMAELLAVSPRSIYRFVERREIPFVRVGGRS